MLRPSYTRPDENPRLDPRRPPNPRDERHSRAWLTFGQMLDAAFHGHTARARVLLDALHDEGCRVEPLPGTTSLRLVLPEGQRRTA